MRRVTLRDYANERGKVVLTWSAIGNPNGSTTPIGHPDFDFAERRNLMDLRGEINSEGVWLWCGQEDPSDDRGNSILWILCREDEESWDRLVATLDN